MEAVVISNLKLFVYDDSWKNIFAKTCRFKKDTQFQIHKPKSRETLTKSKTQHVDDEWDQGISKIVNGVCRCALRKKGRLSKSYRWTSSTTNVNL